MVDSSQLMLPAFYALVLGEEKKSLDLYLKAIKNILKNESLTQISPRIHDAKEIPKETLGLAFDAVSSFIRGGTFDQNSAPEAYNLFEEFRPNSGKQFTRFTTPQEKLLLQALRICSGFTVALVAWDKKDRATALKRYQETINFAAAHTPWDRFDPNSEYLDHWASQIVRQVKENYANIVRHDTEKARSVEYFQIQDPDTGSKRRDEIMVPNVRQDASGANHLETTFEVATDMCASCQKRDVKLPRCKCRMVAYCNKDCQVAHWKTHKTTCPKISDTTV